MNDKRIALVTGGNQGVGLQVVKELVADGVTVLLGSRDRGYVRPSSSFPAFGSDPGSRGRRSRCPRSLPGPLTCGDPVSAGPS